MFRHLFWLGIGLFFVSLISQGWEPQWRDRTEVSVIAELEDPTHEVQHDEKRIVLAAVSTKSVPSPTPAVLTAPISADIMPVSFDNTIGDMKVVIRRDAPKGHVSNIASNPVAAPPVPDGKPVIVTGSRVNLRSAPTTASTVITALTGGTAAVLVGTKGNWAEIHVPELGTNGFMAASFLAPAG